MLVYQDITGYSRSIIGLTFNLQDALQGFSVAIGAGTNEDNGLDYSGILFSGYEGYIFDQDGDFVGGYRENKQFTITTHIHEDSHVSYYIDDVLIKNNYVTLTTGSVNRIEFEKHGDSSVYIYNEGEAINKT